MTAPLKVPHLPPSYEQRAVQHAFRSLAEDVDGRLRTLETRGFPPGTLSGDALVAGTVPPEALDRARVGIEVVSWPSEAEAVEVRRVHSPTLDRLVTRTSTGISGPGRIWDAAEPEVGRGARFYRGPVRLRLVGPGDRFGVMGIRLPPTADLAANSTPGVLIQYGVVVRGIRHGLGRRPERVLGAQAVGDAPTSFRTFFTTGNNGSVWASGGTTRDFWWNRTTEEHLTLAPYPFAEAFGLDANLAPSGASLRDTYGFAFQLITGRNAGEVWRQLCSRRVLGRGLYQSGHAPSATIPAGLPLEAPTTPTVVDWVAPTTYTHRVEGYDLTTAGTRVVMGMPFSYDDCETLVADEERCSMVVMPIGEKLLSQAGLASLASPEEWHRNGLRTTGAVVGRLRSWALDAIID